MGNTDSTQKLGERVLVAKRALEQDKSVQSERYEYFRTNCPEILDVTMKSVAASFRSCSPFLEPTLLMAWIHDPETCQKYVLDSSRRVLSAPIKASEYGWFREYVFPSSVWFFKVPNDDTYMYQELLSICKDMSRDIIDSMDSIYELIENHARWNKMIDIKNTSSVLRQDHPKVGLLQDQGFKKLFKTESKTDESKDSDTSESMKSYIDSNLAINMLTSTAKNIDGEFQNHIKTVMSHYGIVKPGPMKKVERCVGKLENDYSHARFPKCAKLLDIVRCSITFNTVDQLINGYHALMKHISNNQSIIELARVKNGFLDREGGGYRDIKVNVIYKSQIVPDTNMIVEIQLLLIQYLQEKKRIHKLYSILRDELYFQMCVQKDPNSTKGKDAKDAKSLQFVDLLNVGEVDLSYTEATMGRCSVDQDLGLLGLEGVDWFGVVDMQKKKCLFEIKRDAPFNPWYGRVTHQWIEINHEKYVSVQTSKTEIKMFKVTEQNKFVEDEKYRITIPSQGSSIINYCAFDRNFESILLIINYSTIQKRSMKNVNNITDSITLEENIAQSSFRQLCLSNDGSLCGLGGGGYKNYFYVIDFNTKAQFRMQSSVLSDTYAPCFINGENRQIAFGDKAGRIEVWDIEKKVPVRTLNIGVHEWITAMASTTNILAVASLGDKQLRLYDVLNWECFYIKKFNFRPCCLHLTPDLQYLTLSGLDGDRCFVLQIE